MKTDTPTGILIKIFVGATVFIVVMLMTLSIFYIGASEVCVKKEMKPVRYEYTGLFRNTKTTVPTTEGNQDAYKNICVKKADVKFLDILNNMEMMIKGAINDQ